MNNILMFMMKSCPYCRKALGWMEELQAENPMFKDLSITMIDESRQPDVARRYDYYYVPTYYIDNVKVHEGAATKEIIRRVFEKALEN